MLFDSNRRTQKPFHSYFNPALTHTRLGTGKEHSGEEFGNENQRSISHLSQTGLSFNRKLWNCFWCKHDATGQGLAKRKSLPNRSWQRNIYKKSPIYYLPIFIYFLKSLIQFLKRSSNFKSYLTMSYIHCNISQCRKNMIFRIKRAI